MKPKVSLVTLGVADLERSLKFYRDGLGLPPKSYDPDAGVVFFRMEGDMLLAIWPREELAKDAGISPEGSGFGGISLAHNVPSKEAVDTVFAEALAAGAKALRHPADVFWGGYTAYFADPDGHLWEVAWNPDTDLT
ncbi:MAG TPA: VOC family protein [Croceibacterium sp.]|nr:VOC family protein [Croceibacterium sp.]